MGILRTSLKLFINNITCTRKRLSSYTDEFTVVMKLDELALSDPSGGSITFKFKSEQNRVVHFFRWQFKSIWSSAIDTRSDSFSMLQGTMIPQSLFKDNLNISTAFRGPDPTVLAIELTPTYYADEINTSTLEGYRVRIFAKILQINPPIILN